MCPNIILRSSFTLSEGYKWSGKPNVAQPAKGDTYIITLLGTTNMIYKPVSIAESIVKFKWDV